MKSNCLKYGIGIDMAMEKFDACISVIDEQQRVTVKATHKFTNNPSGFNAFNQWVGKHCKLAIPVVYLVEATGVYYEQLAWSLYRKEKQISVVLPNKAKSYLKSLGLKSKNDKMDAKGLSRMVCEQHLQPWQPGSDQMCGLRLITRQIESLSGLTNQLACQLHAYQYAEFRDKEVERMVQKNMDLFKKQKKQLERRVETIIQNDEFLKERFDQICQIKGLGLVSLATIVAETHGFALFENQAQLVSYAGYDVVENTSGTHVGKTRISKKGNSHIRRALHFPALNVVKYEAKFRDFYQRIFETTKMKMKGYTAVQKKLLTIIYSLWKKQEGYITNYNDIEELITELTAAPGGGTSGNEEPKPSFGMASKKPKKVVPILVGTTQDEPLYNESPEALFRQL